ncbi:MAG: SDR family NAD(P)-dependent oxidoreductase [candidate division Zixibacteria bacterium]
MSEPTLARSILITGGNGFIGSRLCHFFIEKGWRVIASVRENSDLSLLDKLPVELRHGDITKPETLTEMVVDVDVIIHNAGLIKARNKDTFYAVNVEGTKNLFEVVLSNKKLQKIVYVSSLAAAGPSSKGKPLTEAQECNPITLYGRSKLAGEQAALSFSDRLNVTVVRPPAVYGPGDREVFSFFQTLFYHVKPLLGNSSRRVQMVHVEDLCRGIYQATVSETESGAVYFICENRSYKYGELVSLLHKASGKRAIPLVIPGSLLKVIAALSERLFRSVGATPMLTVEKANELLAWWEIDTTLASEEINFTSAIPFAEGAEQTYDWYRRKGWL